MSLVHTVFSAILNIETWILFILNILCFYCIVRGKLLSLKSNPIYLIIAYNLVIDSTDILVHGIFIGPSMYLKRAFFNEKITSFLSIFFWFTSSFIQIVLASNRVTVVLLPSVSLFTHRRIVYILSIVSAIALVLTSLAQVIIPCCRLKVEPYENGYHFVTSNETNYANYSVYLPVNVSTSLICLVSYVVLFYYTMKFRSYSKNTTLMHETRLCFQCAMMCIVYTASWFIYLLFPDTTPDTRTMIATVPLTYLGTNAIVYLIFNRDIKSQLRSMKESSTRYFTWVL